jgi:uncharacterized protein YbaR (Trm112 family)
MLANNCAAQRHHSGWHLYFSGNSARLMASGSPYLSAPPRVCLQIQLPAAFMLQPELLAILRCPDNQTRLSQASDATVERLNAAIRAGRITNRAGKQPEGPLDGGLVREDGAYLYPIIDGIPVLLRNDAIPLSQVNE